MANSTSREDRPATAKQLKYLRTLADRAGQTFASPRTVRQASAEIDRLLSENPLSRVERRVERKHIADAIARGPENAANVDLDRETEGYGSDCRWSH